MRRKCRLTDTWLTQRVLLDSWNVTLSQGAERCTLNLSLSNNRSPSICLLELNVEMTDLLRKENILDTLSARPTAKRRSKLLVLITKYKCLLLFLACKYKYSNVENLHKRQHIVRWVHGCWLFALSASAAQTSANTKGGQGRNGVFCTSVAKTEPIKGYSSSMVC